MKALKYIVLGIVLLLIGVVIFAFVYLNGLKSTPEWYKAPEYVSEKLHDSIFTRASSRLENAFNKAKKNDVFKVMIDVRTLRSYLALNHSSELEANGIEEPTLSIVDDHLRLSTKVLKGPLTGAVLYTDLFLEVTKDGKLAITHGDIMAGKRKVPDLILAKIKEAVEMDIDRFVISPQDLGYDGIIIKYSFDVQDNLEDVIFTLRKVK